MQTAVKVSGANPVLVDSYLSDAIEVDVDALADGTDVHVAGIMEHIEEAGVHSGDSACTLPPYSLADATVEAIAEQTRAMALALNVVGLMNVQFAVKPGADGADEIYILEVNPRASRTVPFVAKATGVPIAKIAARIMAGERLGGFGLQRARLDHIAVKDIDRDFGRAFAKSQLGSGTILPLAGTVFVSVRDRDKEAILGPSRRLVEMGFSLLATSGTARALEAAGLPVGRINKVLEGRPHIVDAMKSGEVQLVFNTTDSVQAITDSFSLRRTALVNRIPYYTTASGARAAVEAIAALKAGQLEVLPLQSYFIGGF